MPIDKPIAVVTGASRGAGAGIAHALGSHGCTVYVTGRTQTGAASSRPGTERPTSAAKSRRRKWENTYVTRSNRNSPGGRPHIT